MTTTENHRHLRSAAHVSQMMSVIAPLFAVGTWAANWSFMWDMLGAAIASEAVE